MRFPLKERAEMVPILNPRASTENVFRPVFFYILRRYIKLNAKALVFWQWCNHLASKCPAGKKLVWINMDETSVALYNGVGKGNVFFSRSRRGEGPEPAQRIDKSMLRTNLTMISFCRSEPALQVIMPHIIIGDCHTFKAGEFLELLNNTPTNVYLLREKSAWNNSTIMLRICDLLHIILQPHVATCYFILGVDAAGCHIKPETPLAYRRSFVHFVLIPAKLTFLLQVLDTHGFRRGEPLPFWGGVGLCHSGVR